MLRFVLTIGGSAIPFTPLNDSGPYPLLKEVGAIRIAARSGAPSGFGATEAPSGSVSLKNSDGLAANLIGNPMRARGEIYDGDTLAFVGFVASVRYGLVVALNLES